MVPMPEDDYQEGIRLGSSCCLVWLFLLALVYCSLGLLLVKYLVGRLV